MSKLKNILSRLIRGKEWWSHSRFSNKAQAIKDVEFMNDTTVTNYINIVAREAKGDFSFSDFSEVILQC